MLAWFVHAFVNANQIAPNYILVLFIVSVVALVWAGFTVFSYHRSSSNARFVAVVDLFFVGGFIAGLYLLRFITGADCSHIEPDDAWVISAGGLASLAGQGIDILTSKPCGVLKASLGFGILNCLLFFCTSVMAWIHGGHLRKEERDHRAAQERNSNRASHNRHRSRSGDHRSRAGDYRSRSGDHRSRSGSHRSSRGSYSRAHV